MANSDLVPLAKDTLGDIRNPGIRSAVQWLRFGAENPDLRKGCRMIALSILRESVNSQARRAGLRIEV